MYLAAAAVVVAAATVILISVATDAVIATAAEQDQKDDDPAHIPTAETIVIHSKYLQVFLTGLTASFQGIHLLKFCASTKYKGLAYVMQQSKSLHFYFSSQSFIWLDFS